MKAEGFVYVATGPGYLAEARKSAALLREHNPGYPICLVTDKADGPVFWDDLVTIPNPVFGLRDKISMHLCPYPKFVFLDTDTHVLGDLGELFQLLDVFDVIGHQLFEGHDYKLEGIPDAFPEFNTGILGFRRGPEVERLFQDWLRQYDEYHRRFVEGDRHYSNLSDQRSFKKVMYGSAVRFAVLGPEYDFVPHHTNFACARVKILHSRATGKLPELGRRLNASLETRAYVPRLDSVVSNNPPGREILRLWIMSSFQLVRYALRHALPSGLRGRLRSFGWVRRTFLHNVYGKKGE